MKEIKIVIVQKTIFENNDVIIPQPCSEQCEQPEFTTSHGCGVLIIPDTRKHQRNAGACDSSREGLAGAKFGMKIWTRIGGSCLGHYRPKQCQLLTKENKSCQISMKKNITSCVMIRLTSA